MTDRIIELAIETLERRRAALEQEIAQLRYGRATHRTTGEGRRRTRTPAERKAQSEAMKAYWAKRRSEARPAGTLRRRRRTRRPA